jgi:hypothetical protein
MPAPAAGAVEEEGDDEDEEANKDAGVDESFPG